MKPKPFMLCMLVTVLSSGLATTSSLLAREPVRMAPSNIADSSATTTTTTADTTARAITQQIAELEVQRALLDSRFTPDSPVVQATEGKLQSLRQRLRQIQPNDNNTAVSKAIKEAIKAKIAELEIERTRLAARFSPESPVIQAINSQLNSLNKRFIRL
jgi:uncharacterized protein involved in exopolysaccharide biosynthesis